MRLGNPGANGKPETRTFLGMSSGLVRAEESIEDALLIFIRNPDTLVSDRHTRLLTFYQECDFYLPARVRILDGILDEIQQKLTKPEFIAQHDSRGRGPEQDLNMPVLPQEGGLAMDVFNQGFQFDGQ